MYDFDDLCRFADESICEAMQEAWGNEDAIPGMMGATQAFGNLIHCHRYVHPIFIDSVLNKK